MFASKPLTTQDSTVLQHSQRPAVYGSLLGYDYTLSGVYGGSNMLL